MNPMSSHMFRHGHGIAESDHPFEFPQPARSMNEMASALFGQGLDPVGSVELSHAHVFEIKLAH
jgi:hypothetical protein